MNKTNCLYFKTKKVVEIQRLLIINPCDPNGIRTRTATVKGW